MPRNLGRGRSAYTLQDTSGGGGESRARGSNRAKAEGAKPRGETVVGKARTEQEERQAVAPDSAALYGAGFLATTLTLCLKLLFNHTCPGGHIFTTEEETIKLAVPSVYTSSEKQWIVETLGPQPGWGWRL